MWQKGATEMSFTIIITVKPDDLKLATDMKCELISESSTQSCTLFSRRNSR